MKANCFLKQHTYCCYWQYPSPLLLIWGIPHYLHFIPFSGLLLLFGKLLALKKKWKEGGKLDEEGLLGICWIYFLDGQAAMGGEERLGEGASGSGRPVPGQRQQQQQRGAETIWAETESRRGSPGQLLPSSDNDQSLLQGCPKHLRKGGEHFDIWSASIWEGRLDNRLVTSGFNPYRWVKVNFLGPSLFSFNRGRIGNRNYSLSVAAG